MANEPTKPGQDYRARPINPDLNLGERLQAIQPEQRVVVEAKVWYKSLTVIVNSALLIAASLLQVVELIFGANLLEPIVRIFTNDPENVARTVTTITQIYSILSLYLRARTTEPITLRTDTKK